MLLQSKYSIPEAPHLTLSRSHLHQMISEPAQPVTSIVGPAGYGKTTLVSTWAHQQSCPVAWYSLDVSDNDPSQFVRYLTESIHQATAGAVPSTRTMVSTVHSSSTTSVITSLLNELRTLPYELIIVLEDLHTLSNKEIFDALNVLIKYLPNGIRLIISGRSAPQLNLAGLRMRGQLCELGEQDLALQQNEVTAFTQQRLNFELSHEQIARLTEISEGWPPVVQLFCLTVKSPENCESLLEDIAQGHRHLLDYLAEEVFDQLDDSERELLNAICILERFDANMAKAISGMQDAPSTLGELVARGLFIHRLDASNQWFRFHPLFATFLERNLELDQRKALHRKAFDLWLERSAPIEAIRHAIRAGHSDLAIDLLEKFGSQMLLSGHHRSLNYCFDFIGDELIIRNPDVALLAARVARNRYNYGRVEKLLSTAEANIRQSSPDSWKLYEGSFATVRAQAAIARGDIADARELAQDALAILDKNHSADIAAATLVIGETDFCLGNLESALEHMNNVESQTYLANDWPTHAWALCQQAEIYFAQALPYRSQEKQQQAASIIEQHHLQGLPIAEFVQRLKAQLCWEWYQIDSAEQSAINAVDNNYIIGEHWLIQEYAVLAKVALARGDKSSCLQWLTKLEGLLISERYHRDWIAHADYSRIAIWEALADAQSVERWLASAEPVSDSPTNHFEQRHGRNHVRALMVVGRLADANRLLRRLMSNASRCNLKTDLLRNVVLIAQLKWEQNERDTAIRQLSKALELSVDAGFIASFIRCGKLIIVMLRALLKESDLDDAIRKQANIILSIAEQQPELTGRARIEMDDALIELLIDSPQAPASLKQSPPTPKEWQVFNLVHSGYSNGKIAEHMGVAPSTIKTHIRSLYQKLDVANRQEAIELAEKMLRSVQGG